MQEGTNPLRRRLMLALAGALLLLLLTSVLGIVGYSLFNRTPTLTDADQQAIKSVTLTAFGAVDQLVVIPHTSPDLSQKIAATDIAAARKHASDVFHSIYDASCAPCQNIASKIDGAIAGQANGNYRALDGGVRDAKWLQIQPSNDGTVTVTLEATTWSKVASGSNVYTPAEDIVMVYTLRKVDAYWLITDQVQQKSAGA